MSGVISSASLTSCPDETINKMTLAQELDDEPKLKRTFSLKKGCTQTRISKRKSKYKDSIVERSSTYADKPRKQSFLNSNSLNRLINKVVHKMTNFSINKSASYPTHECMDSKMDNILSLSSSDIYDNDIRVPPIRPSFFRGDKVPGVIGLRNHGNTCFINAVLQCLSHTDILAEYFVLDQYKVDLFRRNKLNSRKYGTKGEVTEQLAVLLKAIWSCQYNPDISNQFKVVVDKYGSQYRGNNQHDAQEFLLWLLDKVHEDLNTATKKKYKTIKVSLSNQFIALLITLGIGYCV